MPRPLFLSLVLCLVLGYSVFDENTLYLGGNTYTFYIPDAIKTVKKAELCLSTGGEDFLCNVVADDVDEIEDVEAFRIISMTNVTDFQTLFSVNFLYASKDIDHTFPEIDKIYQAYYRLDYDSYKRGTLENKELRYATTNTVNVSYKCDNVTSNKNAKNNSYDFQSTQTIVGTITPFTANKQSFITKPSVCNFSIDTTDTYIEAEDGYNFLNGTADFLIFQVDSLESIPSSMFTCQNDLDPASPIIFQGLTKSDQTTNIIFGDKIYCQFVTYNDVTIEEESFNFRYEGRLYNMTQTTDSGLIYLDEPGKKKSVSDSLKWEVILYQSNSTTTPFNLKHQYYNISDEHQFDYGSYVVSIVCQSLNGNINVACKPVVEQDGSITIIGKGQIVDKYMWLPSFDDYNRIMYTNDVATAHVEYKIDTDVFDFGENNNLELRLVLYGYYDDGDLRFVGASRVVNVSTSSNWYIWVIAVLALLVIAASIALGLLIYRFVHKKDITVFTNYEEAEGSSDE